MLAFLPREVDDLEPVENCWSVMNWSDLSDEQDISGEDSRLPRNAFTEDDAIEGEGRNSSGDESCFMQPVLAKRRRLLVSFSDSG